MLIISKKFTFEAAHHLPHHEGLCHNLHGHSYKLEVAVTGIKMVTGSSRGMIMDFGDLTSICNHIIVKFLDHKNLNETWGNPTAENIVESLAVKVSKQLDLHHRGVFLYRLKLWETEKCFAEWRMK